MKALEADLQRGTPVVLRLAGELDIATADELRASLEEAISGGSSVVVDMSGVVFIDASGLRPILQAAAAMNGSGPLALVNAPLVARLLKLTGLTDISTIVFRDSV
jgi:anti-anti-sigma factor